MNNNRNTTCRAVMALLAAAFCFNAGAQTIDVQMAERIAAQYVSRPKRVGVPVQAAKSAAQKGAKSQNRQAATPYYIYNNADGQGFAIVSGDSRMGDIIGYSDEGSIDANNIPAPLKAMLEAKAATMTAIQVDSVDILPHYVKRPKRFVEPLTSSLWNQTWPYNKYMPITTEGVNAYTGCVALATAMVMYHHKWPEKRSGSASTCNKLDYYDWNNMADDVVGAGETKVNAVATLITDVSVAVGSIVTTTGTSADISRAWSALENTYGYSTRFLSANLLAPEVYLSEIYSELSEGYPIVCAGGDHAFYYDGYDENGLVHCNWGWGGASNGYFNILTVSLGSAQNSKGNYWNDQNCVFARPKDGKHETFGETPITLSVTDPKALSVSEQSVARGGKMNAKLMGVWAKNLVRGEYGTYTGGVGAALFDESGSCVHVFPSPFGDDVTWTSALNFWNFYSSNNPWIIDFSTVDGLANGKYTLRAVSRRLLDKQTGELGNWTLILNCNQIPLVVADNSITVQPTPDKPVLSLVGKPDILVPVNLRGGVDGAVEIEVSNASRYEARGTIAATLHGKGNLQGETYPLSADMIGGMKLIPRLGSAKIIVPICPGYTTTEGSFNLKAGKWSMSLSLVVGEGETIEIPMPDDFEITVIDKREPRVMISRITFYDGSQPTTDNYFDPSQTKTLGMGMHTIMRGTSADYVDETLRYRIIDLADNTCVYESPVLTARLPFTYNNSDADLTAKTRATVDLSTLTRGHTFEVHVDIFDGTAWNDIWNNTSSRPTFSLAPVPTAIDGITETPAKPLSKGRYNINGQRVGTDYKGLVIENGNKFIVR